MLGLTFEPFVKAALAAYCNYSRSQNSANSENTSMINHIKLSNYKSKIRRKVTIINRRDTDDIWRETTTGGQAGPKPKPS